MSSFVSVDAGGNLAASGVTEELIQARIDAAVQKLRGEMSIALELKMDASKASTFVAKGGAVSIKVTDTYNGANTEGTHQLYVSDGFHIRSRNSAQLGTYYGGTFYIN